MEEIRPRGSSSASASENSSAGPRLARFGNTNTARGMASGRLAECASLRPFGRDGHETARVHRGTRQLPARAQQASGPGCLWATAGCRLGMFFTLIAVFLDRRVVP